MSVFMSSAEKKEWKEFKINLEKYKYDPVEAVNQARKTIKNVVKNIRKKNLKNKKKGIAGLYNAINVTSKDILKNLKILATGKDKSKKIIGIGTAWNRKIRNLFKKILKTNKDFVYFTDFFDYNGYLTFDKTIDEIKEIKEIKEIYDKSKKSLDFDEIKEKIKKIEQHKDWGKISKFYDNKKNKNFNIAKVTNKFKEYYNLAKNYFEKIKSDPYDALESWDETQAKLHKINQNFKKESGGVSNIAPKIYSAVIDSLQAFLIAACHEKLKKDIKIT